MEDFAKEAGDQVVVVSAQVEAELKGLDAEERADYLESLGVKDRQNQRRKVFFFDKRKQNETW